MLTYIMAQSARQKSNAREDETEIEMQAVVISQREWIKSDVRCVGMQSARYGNVNERIRVRVRGVCTRRFAKQQFGISRLRVGILLGTCSFFLTSFCLQIDINDYRVFAIIITKSITWIWINGLIPNARLSNLKLSARLIIDVLVVFAPKKQRTPNNFPMLGS